MWEIMLSSLNGEVSFFRLIKDINKIYGTTKMFKCNYCSYQGDYKHNFMRHLKNRLVSIQYPAPASYQSTMLKRNQEGGPTTIVVDPVQGRGSYQCKHCTFHHAYQHVVYQHIYTQHPQFYPSNFSSKHPIGAPGTYTVPGPDQN